jgi:hypothetical protein
MCQTKKGRAIFLSVLSSSLLYKQSWSSFIVSFDQTICRALQMTFSSWHFLLMIIITRWRQLVYPCVYKLIIDYRVRITCCVCTWDSLLQKMHNSRQLPKTCSFTRLLLLLLTLLPWKVFSLQGEQILVSLFSSKRCWQNVSTFRKPLQITFQGVEKSLLKVT